LTVDVISSKKCVLDNVTLLDYLCLRLISAFLYAQKSMFLGSHVSIYITI